jgi:hypothetical protein
LIIAGQDSLRTDSCVIGEVNAKVLFTVLGELLSEFNCSFFGVFELK